VDAENALAKTNNKFISRFTQMEQQALEQGKPLADMTLSEMDAIWDSIKNKRRLEAVPENEAQQEYLPVTGCDWPVRHSVLAQQLCAGNYLYPLLYPPDPEQDPAEGKDFEKLSRDTALLASLVDRRYQEATLEKLINKGYYVFLYGERVNGQLPELLFWNTQEVLPDMTSPATEVGSRTIIMANGIYVRTERDLYLKDGRRFTLVALIPVLRKYAVQTENLQKEFVDFSKAIKQVDIASGPTDFAVKGEKGNILFYLQKTNLHNQQSSVVTIIFVLLGFLLLFLLLHQIAIYLHERFRLLV